MVDAKPWLVVLCRFKDIPEIRQAGTVFADFFQSKKMAPFIIFGMIFHTENLN